MLQKLGGVALALALLISSSASSFAAGTDQSALAPGKPAGVKEAAMRAPLWVWIAGVGFVALGIGLVASGSSHGSSGGSSTGNPTH
jgi:hypothetical protein